MRSWTHRVGLSLMCGGIMANYERASFKIISEDWNEYETKSGLTIRVKLVVAKIEVERDDDGRLVMAPNGSPQRGYQHPPTSLRTKHDDTGSNTDHKPNQQVAQHGDEHHTERRSLGRPILRTHDRACADQLLYLGRP